MFFEDIFWLFAVLPAIIVIISAAPDQDNYINDELYVRSFFQLHQFITSPCLLSSPLSIQLSS